MHTSITKVQDVDLGKLQQTLVAANALLWTGHSYPEKFEVKGLFGLYFFFLLLLQRLHSTVWLVSPWCTEIAVKSFFSPVSRVMASELLLLLVVVVTTFPHNNGFSIRTTLSCDLSPVFTRIHQNDQTFVTPFHQIFLFVGFSVVLLWLHFTPAEGCRRRYNRRKRRVHSGPAPAA